MAKSFGFSPARLIIYSLARLGQLFRGVINKGGGNNGQKFWLHALEYQLWTWGGIWGDGGVWEKVFVIKN